MAEHLDRGTFGEQSMGFFLGSLGYFFIDGPGGTEGHKVNARGFDGVAYNIKLDNLIIYDNKAWTAYRNVDSATAIDPAENLTKNLDEFYVLVKNMRDLPAQSRILELLAQTRSSVTGKCVSPPPNVQIAVTTLFGNPQGVTRGLAGRGVKYLDANSAPRVPTGASRIYINETTIPEMAQSANAELAAYNARRGALDAAAEASRFIFQSLNDAVLTSDIKSELKRLTAPIGDAIARGGGALVVVNINASSPPGNVGMVIARSINSAYVVANPNSNMQEAVMLWKSEPSIKWVPPAHVQVETQLFWIAAPKVP